jgi:cytochrome c
MSVKSTKVQRLRRGYLYFVTGYSQELELTVIKVQNRVPSNLTRNMGGRVNSNRLFVGIAALGLCGLAFAQERPAKKAAPGGAGKNSAAAARGKETFEKKCAVCHYADSDAKKIGPGLKGISKRGTFTVNNNKVTDESLKTWIENGDTLMPPFKEVLEPAQIKDVVAYVKTL